MIRENLINEIVEIRGRLLLLTDEYDSIVLKEAKALRIEYTDKIGVLECEQYELYLKIEELKKKIEMVQAAINKHEKPDIVAINHYVAEKLQAFYEKLSDMRGNVLELVCNNNGTLVSAADYKDIKKLYRKLSKYFHPDVCLDKTDYDKELWEKIKDAYERNDLLTLQIIEQAYSSRMNDDLSMKTDEELLEIKAVIEANIKKIKLNISMAREVFPFTEEEHLKNDAWVEARQTELKLSIEEYKRGIELLQVALQNLVLENTK